jgi:hypothetical protein
MKYSLIFVFILVILSCTRSQKSEDQTVLEPVLSSNEPSLEKIPETYIPEKHSTSENELLFDFLYGFGYNTTFQLSRIKFPLSVYSSSGVDSIIGENWLHDPLFVKKECLTHFIQGHKNDFKFDIDIGDELKFYWIYPDQGLRKAYCFKRDTGEWFLHKIEYSDLGKDYTNDFVAFYANFLQDSVFQKDHIVFPLVVNTYYDAPDEMFKDTTYSIAKTNWHILSSDSIMNFEYSWSKNTKFGDKQMIFLNGNDNGIYEEYYFEKINNEWFLVLYNDQST